MAVDNKFVVEVSIVKGAVQRNYFVLWSLDSLGLNMNRFWFSDF
jgi:hypothetical protein